MLDLNKLRSEFEAQHSDKVFKIVKFDEATNAYCLHDHLPLTEINLSALAEINYGWDLWQKAKAQALPETHLLIPKEPNRKTIMAMACVCLGPVGSGPEFLTLKEAKDVYSALVEKESGAEG